MPAQEIANTLTEALAPDVPLSIDQLSALLLVLAVATVLLAVGLGHQVARAEKRIRALEAALAGADETPRAAKGAM